MRHSNWQFRLTELISSHKDEQFNFETLNCLFWAFKGITAVTDVDHLPEYKDKAISAKIGKRALKDIDKVATVQECLMKRLDQTELLPIALARPGDIVFIDDNVGGLSIQQELKLFGPTPGICYGTVSYFLGEKELIAVPTIRLDNTLWVL